MRISLLERVSGRRERQKVGDQARPGRVCNQAASIGYGKEASVAAWNGFYCTNPSQPRRQLSFELFQSHKTSSIGIFACPRKSPYFRYAWSGETLCNECSRRGNPMMRIKHGDEDYKQRAPAARLSCVRQVQQKGSYVRAGKRVRLIHKRRRRGCGSRSPVGRELRRWR